MQYKWLWPLMIFSSATFGAIHEYHTLFHSELLWQTFMTSKPSKKPYHLAKRSVELLKSLRPYSYESEMRENYLKIHNLKTSPSTCSKDQAILCQIANSAHEDWFTVYLDLKNRHYPKVLSFLLKMGVKTPINRSYYEQIQLIYSWHQKGSGRVALEGP